MSTSDLDEDKPLPPEQQKIVARVRWLMLISGFATMLGIAVVIGVIGYRFFRANGSVAPAEVTALLPKGAKVTATAVADDRIAVMESLDLPRADMEKIRYRNAERLFGLAPARGT